MKRLIALLALLPLLAMGGGQTIMTGNHRHVFAAGGTTSCATVLPFYAAFEAQSLGLSNGATVTTWADVSGNGNTATNGSGTLTYHTNRINGLPAVTFVASYGGSYLHFAPLSWSGGMTFFVIYSFTGYAYGYGDIVGASYPGLAYGVLTPSPYYQYIGRYGVPAYATGTNALTTGTWYGGSGEYNGTTATLRLNGVVEATGTSSAVPSSTTSSIGSSAAGSGDFFGGQIAAVYILNSAATPAQVTSMETCLHSVYGLY
jgi:hypothetical protein